MATFSSQRQAEASRVRRRLGNGTEYEITSYLGAGMPKDAVGPVGYLVEQERNSTILPHFHQANQFQVVVAGGGLLGKLPVGPVTVHYAGAFTPTARSSAPRTASSISRCATPSTPVPASCPNPAPNCPGSRAGTRRRTPTARWSRRPWPDLPTPTARR